jgi:hypothetical protein
MEAREKTQEPYTGLKREADTWVVYLRGKVVGECMRFSQGEAVLAQVTATAPAVQEVVPVAPMPPVVTGPLRVTIVAIGRRDWPGSRHVTDERLELVQVDNGEARPPKKPMTLNAVLDWLERQGLAPEATTSTGMAVWTPLDGGRGNVEARRRCVFVRATA